MSHLSSSPQRHTIVRVEARKSFAFAVEIVDAAGNLVDLTDCALSLVVAKQPHRGGEVVLDMLAEMLEDGQGRAQFLLQAVDLDLAPGEYPFALVLITADEYSVVVAKGLFDIQANVEADSTNFTVASTQPSQTLTAKILKDNRVQVRVGHFPYPALRIGSVQTVENDEDAGASIEGVYPLQLLHLSLPKGGRGDRGAAPTIDIGTVSVAGPGLPADATMSGSALARKLNLVLPQPEAYPVVAVPTEDGYAISSPVVTDNGDGTVDVDLTDTIHVAHAQHRHPLTEIDELDPLLEQITEQIDTTATTLEELVGTTVVELSEKIEAVRARVPEWSAKEFPADSIVQHNGWVWRTPVATDAEDSPALPVPTMPSVRSSVLASMSGTTHSIQLPANIETGDYIFLMFALYGGTGPSVVPADFTQVNSILYYKVATDAAAERNRVLEVSFAQPVSTAWNGSHRLALVMKDVTAVGPSATVNTSQNPRVQPLAAFSDEQMAVFFLSTTEATLQSTSPAMRDVPIGSVNGKQVLELYAGPHAGTDVTFNTGKADFWRGALTILSGLPARMSAWLPLFELGATNDYLKLLNVPAQFPPVPHDTSLLTTGTMATARLPAGNTGGPGILEVATHAEVATGTDTQRAVTPAGVRQELNRVSPSDYNLGKSYLKGELVDHIGYCWTAVRDVPAEVEPLIPVTAASVEVVGVSTSYELSSPTVLDVELPAGRQVGDLLVVGLVTMNSIASLIPAGWVARAQAVGTGRNGRVFTRFCSGTEGGFVTFTSLGSSTAGQIKAVVVLLRGAQGLGSGNGSTTASSATRSVSLEALGEGDTGIVIGGLLGGAGGRSETLSTGTLLGSDNSGSDVTISVWSVPGPRAKSNVISTASANSGGVLLTIPTLLTDPAGVAWRRRYELID